MEADGKKFKKATQEVGRPPVTDHDMHEDLMKNPPMNDNNDLGNTAAQSRGLKEGSYEETESLEQGVLGQPGLGRAKHLDVEGQSVQDNSLHS